MDVHTRRQGVRALPIQAALWARTFIKQNAILEEMQELPDWEDPMLDRP